MTSCAMFALDVLSPIFGKQLCPAYFRMLDRQQGYAVHQGEYEDASVGGNCLARLGWVFYERFGSAR